MLNADSAYASTPPVRAAGMVIRRVREVSGSSARAVTRDVRGLVAILCEPEYNWLAGNLRVAAALAESGYDFRLL